MRPILPRISTLSCIAIALVASGLSAQTVQPESYEETGFFTGQRLQESSGIAVSRSQWGILWTHNDSGDREFIYAIDIQGRNFGRIKVRGADAKDWEDISLGRCPLSFEHEHCLYVADTGDNDGDRDRGTIYIFPEPDLADRSVDSEARTERASEIKVRYPGGPRDIEGLAVNPDGDILLVSKGTHGPIILYEIPADSLEEEKVTAAVVDTLPIVPAPHFGRLVTAASLSTDGSRLALRTYPEIYFFERDSDSAAWKLAAPPCWLGLNQPQGEALDFLNDTLIVLTSESALGRVGGIARVVCPRGFAPGNRNQD